ncbi:MAG: DUF4326 domain-containing protein [Candidatus Woesearchaeota archaeon]
MNYLNDIIPVKVGKVPYSTYYCGRSEFYKPEYGIDCSVLANPFVLYRESDREECIKKYKHYFIHKMKNDVFFKKCVYIFIK